MQVFHREKSLLIMLLREILLSNNQWHV